jgi:hypothetical protein
MTVEEKQRLCAQVNDLIARAHLDLPDALGVLEIVKFKMLRDAYDKRGKTLKEVFGGGAACDHYQ